ncbi:glucose-6-phosphate isomerase [Helicobacter cappadocius]|uniref:Glucose-6-phosphate isomerase n=1 Tax=Helicobacter cappadocius TaxID=3063998 RepID=A0AA90PM50_9HELI|nr:MULTISPECIES: glucose-6-phosphate isomerase [unclassified Helicobacter]MDO7253765.1 glucose-6-phosphate isomerase [Helicobacter sp. faydin-H75]MDP2539694.1 glucose-6-phosphate isomerase [Helicobacter sp. faydin-H76]
MLTFNQYFDKNSDLRHLANPNQKALDSVFDLISLERKNKKSGYYELPFEQKALQESHAYVKEKQFFLDSVKNIVIIGIGGSSLGLKAIDGLLSHLPARKKIQLAFLEHTDPIEIQKSLYNIHIKDSLFIIISKSGTTIETSSLMKYVIHRYGLFESFEKKSHLLFITDEDSPLYLLGKKEQVSTVGISKNIGGRFSVLSAVGVLPLMLLGYDVERLLEGAAEFEKNFFERKEEHLLKKAIFLAKNRDRFPINILFSYSSVFKDFNSWYVQLWGESLGKFDIYGKKVGLTPISLIGSIDQHSFLQLIAQGLMDKTITFLSIHQAKYIEPKIPDISFEYLGCTDFVNGASFAKLLNVQQIATMETIQNEGIPTDHIELEELCETNVGKLIIYFELLTSCVGGIFNINSYDQPGVELGKIRLREIFKILSKA